jgi:hypothetical protein
MRPNGSYWKTSDSFLTPAIPLFDDPVGSYVGYASRWIDNSLSEIRTNLTIGVGRDQNWPAFLAQAEGGFARFEASSSQAARRATSRRPPSISSVEVMF